MNMPIKLYNLARMVSPTVGTGLITLTTAVNSFLSFAQAGVQDGDEITFAIEDGASREIGRGVYSATGQTLTRNVLRSTNGNNPIALTGRAQVAITAAAEDFVPEAPTDGEMYGRQFNGTEMEWVALVGIVDIDGGVF